MTELSIAVVIPCYNEAGAIAEVIADFRSSLPTADIYVLDNNSRDGTADIAAKNGATVMHVRQQGKGNVVRQAFAKIDADVYVMADGDGTYEVTRAHALVEALVAGQLDMVVGVREHQDADSYRGGHVLGNRMFTKLAKLLFSDDIADMFSGYRAYSRAFAKSFPALATGFETETEMSLHAAQLRLPVGEVKTEYGPRADGTESKLNTYRDGFRILVFTLRLFKIFRPFYMFAVFSAICALVSLAFGVPVIVEFAQTGLVPKLPTAVVAATLMLMSAIGLFTGLILDNASYAQKELKRLAYLAILAGTKSLND